MAETSTHALNLPHRARRLGGRILQFKHDGFFLDFGALTARRSATPTPWKKRAGLAFALNQTPILSEPLSLPPMYHSKCQEDCKVVI